MSPLPSPQHLQIGWAPVLPPACLLTVSTTKLFNAEVSRLISDSGYKGRRDTVHPLCDCTQEKDNPKGNGCKGSKTMRTGECQNLWCVGSQAPHKAQGVTVPLLSGSTLSSTPATMHGNGPHAPQCLFSEPIYRTEST